MSYRHDLNCLLQLWQIFFKNIFSLHGQCMFVAQSLKSISVYRNNIQTITNYQIKPATVYWSVFDKPGQWVVMNMRVRGISFASFYEFSVGFLKYSDSVVFCAFHFINIIWLSWHKIFSQKVWFFSHQIKYIILL